MENNCYRDKESGKVLNFFTIGKNATDKPIWSEAFPKCPYPWSSVMEMMQERGVPITSDTFQGHFIGLPGETGRKIGRAINNGTTRYETAKRQIEYQILCGDYVEAEKYIRVTLRKDIREIDYEKLLMGMEQAFLNAGAESVQLSIAIPLLKAKHTVESV